VNALDYIVIGVFFALVIYFGYLFKQVAGNTRGFFLAGRSLPGWLAGISFVSGNVSAMEILGLTGGAYVYGMVFAQYDWVGAIPAIVALSLVFVPFYYTSRIYNLPAFLGRRYGDATRTAHSLLMLSYMLLALGTGLYMFALALNVMLGWPIPLSAAVAAVVLGVVTASGGLPASASWSTDQAIMQNVLAARSLEDARKAPLIGGAIKLAVPLISVIPGLCAAVPLPNLERPDTAIFQLVLRYYPTGLAGLGFLSVMAAFSAMNVGMITGSAPRGHDGARGGVRLSGGKMRLDMLFFLGIFYTVLGGLVLAGWLLTREPWNLYGGLMMLVGLLLVAVRPRPPLRFFLGRVRPEERLEQKDSMSDMGM
jgi:uncharacterized sodium:solute symporter family permease YidK